MKNKNNDYKEKKGKNDKKSTAVGSSLFFNMMFDNARHTCILLMNTNGTILDANFALLNEFGYPKDRLIGNNFSMLFIEEDREKNLPGREIKKVMETGSANDENFLLQENGKATWVHGESILVKDEQGNAFIVKVIQNINQERLLQFELKKSNEELERIITDHETFIYAASHDLQAPINNIEGLVNALKEQMHEPKEVNQLIEMIYKLIYRFKTKINELSGIAKEQEEGKKETGEIEFQHTFDKVLLDLRAEIKSADAEIIADFSKAPTIKYSEKNIQSILQNLLSNAVKFRSLDGPLKIVVETDKINDDFVVLKIQDNGLGIKEEDKDKIFQMYKRLHHQHKGTGVGMAIVKRIVDNSGGRIELESMVGEGTTFKIFLPEN